MIKCYKGGSKSSWPDTEMEIEHLNDNYIYVKYDLLDMKL